MVSSAFEKTYSVKKGETIYLNYTIKYSMTNIRNFYNVLAKENGWQHMKGRDGWANIFMPCKIVGFFPADKPHGKFPKSMAEDMIIME